MRTHDFNLGKVEFCRKAKERGTPGKIRTCDFETRKLVLYGPGR